MARQNKARMHLHSKTGYSMVELLVYLALLNLVLAAAYSFYFYGYRAFAAGDKQTSIQQQARLAANFISRDIRYATTIELLSPSYTIPDAALIPENTHFIFISTENSLEYRTKDLSRIIFDTSVNDFELDSVNFVRKNNVTLEFTIQADWDNGNPYQVSSSIFAENLAITNTSIQGASGVGIRYVRAPYVPPNNLQIQPALVTENSSFSQVFTLALQSGEFSDGIEVSHITLTGDFSGLNVSSVAKTPANTATVEITGNLVLNSGIGILELDAAGWDGDSILSAKVGVLSSTPVEYTLNVNHSGNGNTTPPVGIHTFNSGQTVTLNAAPAAGWLFQRWVIGTDVYTTPSLSVIMNSDKTATAYFQTPTVTASSINYSTHGGGNHLTVRVHLSNNSGMSLSGATISMFLYRNGSLYQSETKTTSTTGVAEFGHYNNAPAGTYTITINSVTLTGHTWDGTTPSNSFTK